MTNDEQKSALTRNDSLFAQQVLLLEATRVLSPSSSQFFSLYILSKILIPQMHCRKQRQTEGVILQVQSRGQVRKLMGKDQDGSAQWGYGFHESQCQGAREQKDQLNKRTFTKKSRLVLEGFDTLFLCRQSFKMQQTFEYLSLHPGMLNEVQE